MSKYVTGSLSSELAALENEPNAGTQRARVLKTLREHPHGLTDHQQQTLLKMDPSTQRPRRVELVEAGLVREAGVYRRTPSGRLATGWIAVTLQQELPLR